MHTSLVLSFVIVSLLISTIPGFAQIEPLLSVTTSDKTYLEGDTIVISGKVTSIILDTPVVIQIFYDVTLVEVAQLQVAQDGSFTHTIIPEGQIWNNQGEYIVRATYGTGNTAEADFNFGKVSQITDFFVVDAGDFGSFDVAYTILGGKINDIIAKPEILGITVIIEPEDNGYITLELPRKWVDAKTTSGEDDEWIILVNGFEVPYIEELTSETRKITIQFEDTDSEIEIIGTFVIPEFGTVSILIFTFAIISIIVITSMKNNFKNLRLISN